VSLTAIARKLDLPVNAKLRRIYHSTECKDTMGRYYDVHGRRLAAVESDQAIKE
jgi:hypothetical protein